MPATITNSRLAIGRRAALLLAGLAAAVAMYAGIAAGPVSQASADAHGQFCNNITLEKFGLCYNWVWNSGHLRTVSVFTGARAGCVTWSNDYNHDLQSSWQCVGNDSWTTKWVNNDGQNHRGVIRSNATGAGVYTGDQTCCW